MVNYEPKRGDLYITDLGGDYGTRPCVIISNDIGNHFSGNVIVVPITSRKKKPMPTHVWMRVCTGLHVPGTATCEHILTIKKYQLKKWIGTCAGKPEEHYINQAVATSIAL